MRGREEIEYGMKPVMRKDVPEELTWDLSALYKTEEDMYADAEKAEAASRRIEAEYKGKLTDPERINACLDEYRKLCETMNLVYSYTDLSVSVDYYDAHNQERNDKIAVKVSAVESRLSFIDSEILKQDDSVIRAAIDLATDNKLYLKNLLREKPHRLEADTEKALAALSNTFNTPYQVYNMAKLADMKFPSFAVDGQEFPMGYSLYEDDYEYDRRMPVRRAAFEVFYGKLREYENVTAAAYQAQVQME